jgi:hypothetical protein
LWFDDQIKQSVLKLGTNAHTQIQAHQAPPSLDIAVAEATKKRKKAPIEAKLAARSLSLAAAEAKHHIPPSSVTKASPTRYCCRSTEKRKKKTHNLSSLVSTHLILSAAANAQNLSSQFLTKYKLSLVRFSESKRTP